MATDGTFTNLSKRERLQVTRQRAKLEKNLGSIADLTRLPSALFIVDVSKEHIAVKEAKRLGIPVFAMVDTNSDPSEIDFPIPANDDASKSIALIISILCQAIEEGLNERKIEKDKESLQKEKKGARDSEAQKAASAISEDTSDDDEDEEEDGDEDDTDEKDADDDSSEENEGDEDLGAIYDDEDEE